MGEEGHALTYPWTFTYFKKVANKSYEENTFTLGTTSTVEDFGAFTSTFAAPSTSVRQYATTTSFGKASVRCGRMRQM